MVINVGALKSGDLRTVERDIEAVVDACRQCGVVSKVIIEAALLTDEEKITASTLTKAAGADFVKTSTGFGPGGATAADVALMRRVVGAEMGVKAAGGVRDLEGLKAMVAAGAYPRRGQRRREDRPGIEGTEARRVVARRLLTLFSGWRAAWLGRSRTQGGIRDLDASGHQCLAEPPPELAPDLPLLVGTVLIRNLICIAQSPNASTPRTSIASRMNGP